MLPGGQRGARTDVAGPGNNPVGLRHPRRPSQHSLARGHTCDIHAYIHVRVCV